MTKLTTSPSGSQGMETCSSNSVDSVLRQAWVLCLIYIYDYLYYDYNLYNEHDKSANDEKIWVPIQPCF